MARRVVGACRSVDVEAAYTGELHLLGLRRACQGSAQAWAKKTSNRTRRQTHCTTYAGGTPSGLRGVHFGSRIVPFRIPIRAIQKRAATLRACGGVYTIQARAAAQADRQATLDRHCITQRADTCPVIWPTSRALPRESQCSPGSCSTIYDRPMVK